MNDELLMDLADVGSPLRLVQVILQHHPRWEPPVPVDTLALDVGIVEITGRDMDAFEGALLTDADKTQGVIAYKTGARGGRRQFTVSHELGHFLIKTHIGNRQCTSRDMRERRMGDADRRREAEANTFAAGLLMPKPWFERDMQRLGGADLAHVDRLRERYGVSFEAAANRYIEMSDEPLALVFAQNGVVRYTRTAGGFPTLAIRAGGRLPDPRGPERRLSAWADADGADWLPVEWGRRTPDLLMQRLSQASGFSVTLLQLTDSPRVADEDDDEDEAVERSWEVGFRRR